jgi:hypothetical protein
MTFINPFRTSVSSCMKDFHKAVARLHRVASHQMQRKAAHEDCIDALLERVEVHQDHADKAQAEAQAALLVAEKIKTTFHLK